MTNKKNKNEHRVEFLLNDFLKEKLIFENNTLYFGSNPRLNEVAKIIGINSQKVLKDLGLNVDQKIDRILEDDEIAELAINNNINFEKVDDISQVNVVEKILDIMKIQKWTKDVLISERPPIITIMGHVDHGKTTLLDAIRKSNLISKEIGGITQTIGAYQIVFENKKLTFIDTPGHEAFTEMRANGSKLTDIVVIVVAADDSIMPQTKESIDHAKAAGVPIIIAVNKMDTVGADLEKVKNDLSKIDVVSEEWGGTVPFIPISALKKEGINDLLKNIILISEMQELKSPVNILSSGTVIESNINKQKGNLVSVIVQNGTLKVGDDIIIDDFTGRVKAIYNDSGLNVKEATPGTPVEIYGLGNSAVAGSKFVSTKDKGAQKIADAIHFSKLNKLRKRTSVSAADLFTQLKNSKKTFNVILKTDSFGVLEAISSKVENISTEDIEVKIIRKDVGEITTTDVTLAEASKAHIYTFNIKTSSTIQALMKNKSVNFLEFNIIYKLFENIENKINGLTEDKFEEVKKGKAEIIKLFSFSKIGIIAGSLVKEGSIKKGSLIDIVRDNKVIATSKVKSLQFEKDQLKEALAGRECGITLEDQNIKLEKGDILVSKELVKLN
ncbi:MAG: translation initiation factor IF-2 [Mycoplasmataceae bacterium]|nr:translation initiation factor IF-2 [Mycoplasmataceae bacterium]